MCEKRSCIERGGDPAYFAHRGKRVIDMAPKKTILVVEDEGDLGELIHYNLEREGYVCRHVLDGSDALKEVHRSLPDLIVLDRMLPKKAGDEVAGELRRDPNTADIPIIMLTAKVEESDELVGFALGADDYIRKPFSMKLLLARVAAILRRKSLNVPEKDSFTAGPISLNSKRHEVKVEGVDVSMTTTEFGILKALMAAQGQVLDRIQLIDKVLGADVVVTDRTIDVHISSLRKKLGHASRWIQTIRGVGYVFRPPQ